MKQVFFLTALLFVVTVSFSQNSIQENLPRKTSEKSPWDLDQYVWSHKHYKTGKNDKPIIDFDAIDHWMGIGPNEDLSLSPDGKFFSYSIRRSNTKNHSRDSLVVQSVDGSWRKSFPGISTPGFFTSDSRQYIFLLNDELHFTLLGEKLTHIVHGVQSSKTAPGSNNNWLAYQLKDSLDNVVLLNTTTQNVIKFTTVSKYDFDKSGSWLVCEMKNGFKGLLLHNIIREKGLRFTGVVNYKLGENSKVLILKTTQQVSDGVTKSLKYVNLLNGEERTIWATKEDTMDLINYNLDITEKQVVFTTQDQNKNNFIWYYREGMDKAIIKVDNQANGIDEGLTVQGVPRFTNNGNYILFSLQRSIESYIPSPEAVQLDVWSYKDSILQSAQGQLKREARTYAAIINTVGDTVIRLENEYERLKTRKAPSDFVVIGKVGKLVNGDRFWKESYDKDSNWLVSLSNNSRQLLPTKVESSIRSDVIVFSPGGKYLVYFDPDNGGNYFSYSLQTGKIINISKGVPSHYLCSKDFFEISKRKKERELNYGIAAWLVEDKGLLVYDAYDIWQLDLTGKKKPINITNSYGRRQHILFSLISHDRFSGEDIEMLKSKTDTLLLNAFNRNNKYNGFFQKKLNVAGNPELLYIGPYFFYRSTGLNGQLNLDMGMKPIKAANSNNWIVKRQSAIDAPNYFITKDFKTYIPLTDIQPQNKYNWLTAELHTFKQKDRLVSQGVLYKPENFDSTKKYPVIISFYVQNSDQLYQYPTAEYLICPGIYYNPAWFVSHGYLVLIPDIYFNKEKGWGPSTLNTLEGAAHYLKLLPYVDGKRIGAAGHSNSGRFGYYLLTHSKSFAAMCIGAGMTDILGTAFSIDQLNNHNPGGSKLDWVEVSAAGTGLGELWKNKTKWLDHDAILQSDKVNCPLLLIQNKSDPVLFSQPTELFIALRRLEKKVWWLQYDQGDHVVTEERDMKDLTIRYTQYFDHFLKAAPAPRWMTIGIPNKLKAIESRYELDTEHSCSLPGAVKCLVCDKYNKPIK